MVIRDGRKDRKLVFEWKDMKKMRDRRMDCKKSVHKTE